jgi:hypothetical protein
MLILAKTTLSGDNEIIFSNIGVSCLQGPHQGAQKSTTTNLFELSSRTFVSKSTSLTSMILLFFHMFLRSFLLQMRKYVFFYYFQS